MKLILDGDDVGQLVEEEEEERLAICFGGGWWIIISIWLVGWVGLFPFLKIVNLVNLLLEREGKCDLVAREKGNDYYIFIDPTSPSLSLCPTNNNKSYQMNALSIHPVKLVVFY
jgi:hypothetical protein